MRLIKGIPNILTSLNLLFGCMAMTNALYGRLEIAFWYVIIAAVCDFLDGFSARLLKAYSPIGKELDSLADLVSFGVAPSAVAYTLGCGEVGFIIAVMAALRLAKFNINERQTTEFIGMPTPANALFFMSVGYIAERFPDSFLTQLFAENWVLVAFVFIFGFLMNCELRMFSLKFKTYAFKKNIWVYSFLFFSLLAILFFQIKAIPYIIVGYVIVSIIKQLSDVKQ